MGLSNLQLKEEFQDLEGDVDVLLRLFDLIIENPDLITKDILLKGKNRLICLKNGLQRVQGSGVPTNLIDPSLSRQQSFPSIQTGKGATPPKELLNGILRRWQGKIFVDTNHFVWDSHLLNLNDSIFDKICDIILEFALESQKEAQFKSCEIKSRSLPHSLEMQFKHFRKSHKQDHVNSILVRPGFIFVYKVMQTIEGEFKLSQSQSGFCTTLIRIPFA